MRVRDLEVRRISWALTTVVCILDPQEPEGAGGTPPWISDSGLQDLEGVDFYSFETPCL